MFTKRSLAWLAAILPAVLGTELEVRDSHPYFCSTVFNTVAIKRAGWPEKTWDSLTSHGVQRWVGFIDPDLVVDPSTEPDYIQEANVPITVYNRSFVARGLELMKSDSPPAFLELFNEPDIGLDNQPKTAPNVAATKLADILKYNKNHNVTTFLSPACSHPENVSGDDGWLSQFDDACDGCVTNLDIPIIATHQYNLNADGVVKSLKAIHKRWPNHKIWITELAPSTHVLNDCPMTVSEVGDWMETVVNGAAALGYVERIFWNSGEWRPPVSDNDCMHSLTYNNGSATPLLKKYYNLCSALTW